MKSPADGPRTLLLKSVVVLGAATMLASCAASNRPTHASRPSVVSMYGPQADFPVRIGDPYTVSGRTYTPEDVLNYDEVGFLALDDGGGDTISGAHHTLPLPSYVEVTSLETGRTILARVERRGPMDGHDLLALSRGGLAQLGASAGAPVRVRRVNPPEDQRALLRAGYPAALRMDTPMPLVEVLRRSLPGPPASPALATTSDDLPVAVPAKPADETAATMAVVSSGSSRASPATSATTVSAGPSEPLTAGFFVQAASFSTAERAGRAAEAMGGQVSHSGRYFRVRTGPFATRGEAEASLAKVKAAGYSDARILTNG